MSTAVLRSKEQPDGEQAVDYLRTFLPIPEGCGVLCVIALGYSDFEPKPLPPRANPSSGCSGWSKRGIA